MLTIACKILKPNARMPQRAKYNDLALDVYALEEGCVYPGGRTEIKTGIALETMPECGFLIKERSGHARQGLFCLGGVIDPGYRGELLVVLANFGFKDVQWNAGDRIAQLIPIPFTPSMTCQADELSESERGEQGFGSTGR